MNDNKYINATMIILCLILLRYWTPKFNDENTYIRLLGSIIGSSFMVFVLVFYLTDLNFDQSVYFGIGYCIIYLILTYYINFIKRPKEEFAKQVYSVDQSFSDSGGQNVIIPQR